MEGKEVRFGIFNSALFATVTTDASCGAVNSMHDSFTPLGGFVPLFNIQLGEIIFGGVGAGLYGMLVFVVLAVFLAGLMVGRTPEYLGKKIEAYDVKIGVAGAAGACRFASSALPPGRPSAAWGLAGLNNAGPHGLSAKSSTPTAPPPATTAAPLPALRANTPWYNTTLGAGHAHWPVPHDRARPGPGRLPGRERSSSAQSAGTFPVSGVTFVVLLVGTVLLVGALTFLPGADAWAPIVEHFLMISSGQTVLTDSTMTMASKKHIPSLIGTIIGPGDRRSRSEAQSRGLWSRTRSCSSPRSAPLLTTVELFFRRARRAARLRPPAGALALVHRALRQLRRSHGRRARQGPGRRPAQGAHGDHGQRRLARRRQRREVPAETLRKGDVVVVSAGRHDPGRRRGRRRRRQRGRIRHHRRIRAGHPRERRRPQRRHRRHPRALRPHRDPRHGQSRATASWTA